MSSWRKFAQAVGLICVWKTHHEYEMIYNVRNSDNSFSPDGKHCSHLSICSSEELIGAKAKELMGLQQEDTKSMQFQTWPGYISNNILRIATKHPYPALGYCSEGRIGLPKKAENGYMGHFVVRRRSSAGYQGTSLGSRGGPTKWAAPRLQLNILAMIQLLRQKKEWSGVAKSQLAAIKDHGTILKQVSLGILI